MLNADPRERQNVLRDLESDDDEVRRLAVERSAALAPEEVVARLVERLGDASWRVRKAAVARIAAWHDQEAVARALVAALADGENPGRRNGAVDALIQCGAQMVPHLLSATLSDDVDVRKFAVDALAGIGDASSVPALIRTLQDEDTNVRAAAADALGSIGGDEASAALVGTAVADDQPVLVRFSALRSLATLGVGLSVARLGSALEDPVLRPAALDVLLRRDADGAAIDVLLKALEGRSRAIREAAMRSLLRGLADLDGADAEALARRIRDASARCPELISGAVERLTEADLATRLVLLQFLGLVGSPEGAVPVLLAGADEALAPVALAALESMCEVAEEAIDEVWSDLGPDARRDACAFFGRAAGRRSEGRLVAALEDPEPAVRIEAVRSLGSRRVADALAPLVHRLRQASQDEFEGEDERLAIADALITLADGEDDSGLAGRARELLREALEGAGEPVRVTVARVIGRIGRREDAELLSLLLKDPSAQVRRAAVDALVRVDPTASAEPLHLAIADESVDVRIAAAKVLGGSRSPDVFPDLCRLAEDADPRVRAAAVRAIGLRGHDESGAGHAAAERVLEEACGDAAPVALAAVEVALATGASLERVEALLHRPEPEVVREAVRCLGVHAQPGQLEAVIPLCAHPDWSVRAEVIQVLGEQGVVRAVPAILRRLDLEEDPFVRTVTLAALQRLEG